MEHIYNCLRIVEGFRNLKIEIKRDRRGSDVAYYPEIPNFRDAQEIGALRFRYFSLMRDLNESGIKVSLGPASIGVGSRPSSDSDRLVNVISQMMNWLPEVEDSLGVSEENSFNTLVSHYHDELLAIHDDGEYFSTKDYDPSEPWPTNKRWIDMSYAERQSYKDLGHVNFLTALDNIITMCALFSIDAVYGVVGRTIYERSSYGKRIKYPPAMAKLAAYILFMSRFMDDQREYEIKTQKIVDGEPVFDDKGKPVMIVERSGTKYDRRERSMFRSYSDKTVFLVESQFLHKMTYLTNSVFDYIASNVNKGLMYDIHYEIMHHIKGDIFAETDRFKSFGRLETVAATLCIPGMPIPVYPSESEAEDDIKHAIFVEGKSHMDPIALILQKDKVLEYYEMWQGTVFADIMTYIIGPVRPRVEGRDSGGNPIEYNFDWLPEYDNVHKRLNLPTFNKFYPVYFRLIVACVRIRFATGFLKSQLSVSIKKQYANGPKSMLSYFDNTYNRDNLRFIPGQGVFYELGDPYDLSEFMLKLDQSVMDLKSPIPMWPDEAATPFMEAQNRHYRQVFTQIRNEDFHIYVADNIASELVRLAKARASGAIFTIEVPDPRPGRDFPLTFSMTKKTEVIPFFKEWFYQFRLPTWFVESINESGGIEGKFFDINEPNDMLFLFFGGADNWLRARFSYRWVSGFREARGIVVEDLAHMLANLTIFEAWNKIQKKDEHYTDLGPDQLDTFWRIIRATAYPELISLDDDAGKWDSTLTYNYYVPMMENALMIFDMAYNTHYTVGQLLYWGFRTSLQAAIEGKDSGVGSFMLWISGQRSGSLFTKIGNNHTNGTMHEWMTDVMWNYLNSKLGSVPYYRSDWEVGGDDLNDTFTIKDMNKPETPEEREMLIKAFKFAANQTGMDFTDEAIASTIFCNYLQNRMLLGFQFNRIPTSYFTSESSQRFVNIREILSSMHSKFQTIIARGMNQTQLMAVWAMFCDIRAGERVRSLYDRSGRLLNDVDESVPQLLKDYGIDPKKPFFIFPPTGFQMLPQPLGLGMGDYFPSVGEVATWALSKSVNQEWRALQMWEELAPRMTLIRRICGSILDGDFTVVPERTNPPILVVEHNSVPGNFLRKVLIDDHLYAKAMEAKSRGARPPPGLDYTEMDVNFYMQSLSNNATNMQLLLEDKDDRIVGLFKHFHYNTRTKVVRYTGPMMKTPKAFSYLEFIENDVYILDESTGEYIRNPNLKHTLLDYNPFMVSEFARLLEIFYRGRGSSSQEIDRLLTSLIRHPGLWNGYEPANILKELSKYEFLSNYDLFKDQAISMGVLEDNVPSIYELMMDNVLFAQVISDDYSLSFNNVIGRMCDFSNARLSGMVKNTTLSSIPRPLVFKLATYVLAILGRGTVLSVSRVDDDAVVRMRVRQM